MKSRTIGEPEGGYRLLPSLTLAMSNVTCLHVPTELESERSSRFKRATEEQINAGVPCIEINNHEGLWYEQDSFWSKYLRRPHQLKDICFAQFSRMYVTMSPSKNTGEEEEEVVDDNDVLELVEPVLDEEGLEEDEES